MLTRIDSFFKKVSNRTFKALQTVRSSKELDVEETLQNAADVTAQEKLAEIMVMSIVIL